MESLAETSETLRDLVWGARDVSERDRRLAPEVVKRIRETGLARASLPRADGGAAWPAPATLPLYETLARADASAPWILFNNALVCLFARFMSPALRREIFAEPGWLYAQSTRPTGTIRAAGESMLVSGRWTLVSGCELAEWMLLLCRLGDSDDDTRFAVVHRGEATIVDTWESGGLRGTGSHDVVVEELRVPPRRVVAPGPGARAEEALDRIPVISTVAAFFAAIALGVGQGALDALAELARAELDQRPPGPTALVVARSTRRLEASRRSLHDTLGATWDAAVAGRPAALEAIGDVYSAVLVACEDAQTCVDAAFRAAGTRALYSARPFERAQRDLYAMLQHVIAQPIWAEDAGRVRLGLPPEQALYAL